MHENPNDPLSIQWSHFLRQYFTVHPELREIVYKLAENPVRTTQIAQWLHDAGLGGDAPLTEDKDLFKRQLRAVRNQLFALLAVRDIDWQAPLEEITEAISWFADQAVGLAYRFTMRDLVRLYGTPRDASGQPLEMIIIGMGKLGGYELNVSSDIDLIMIYPMDGETDGAKSRSFHEFYCSLTQRLQLLLSEVTADGFVFRTDLRLRPDGNAGPLAWSMDALANYLLKQGREWERYAWLKARPIAVKAFPDSEPEPFLQQLESLKTPFVYRRYFDYHAPSSLRKLRQQIVSNLTEKTALRSSAAEYDDIKLGTGGIREIEFIVQLQQLVCGGCMPSLQEENLLKALQRLEQANLLDEDACRQLAQSYRLLRKTEHILQYRENNQTHLLPQHDAQQALLAQIFGGTWDQFSQHLKAQREAVNRLFNNAFMLADKNAASKGAPAASHEHQKLQGIEALNDIARELYAPETFPQISEIIAQFFNSSRLDSLPEKSCNRLIQLVHMMLKSAADAEFPFFVAARMLDLLDAVAQRSSYLALLAEYPDTIARITRMMDASQWAASYLVSNPLLLQSLINWEELMSPINIAETAEQLERDLQAAVLPDGNPDVEVQMNLMRNVKKQVTFKILAQDLEGILSVEHLADLLSELADRLLALSLKIVWPQLGSRFEKLPEEPDFAIVAYGKLGGKELGYNSDLDLVFLFDDPRPEASDYYTRFARRLINWFSTLTSSGRLYEIDMRLRPDGESGLLVVSVDAFDTYQLNHAWLWEHQAITRARFTAGKPSIGTRFEDIRRALLLKERDPEQLRAQVVSMRQKMRDSHRNPTRLFDVKHDPGGLVDVEFITQFIVLAYARHFPILLENLGNITLLKCAAQENLISLNAATDVGNAYRTLRKTQHMLGLQGFEHARTIANRLLEERLAVIRLWNQIFPQDPQPLPQD